MRQKGVVPLVSLLVIGILAIAAVIAASAIKNPTGFFNRAQENISSRAGGGGTGGTPAPSISWEACINTPGSVLLMTYPEVCSTPDGKKATKPAGSSFCGGIQGIVCPAGMQCVYEGDYPDAGGTCQPVSNEPTAKPTSTPTPRMVTLTPNNSESISNRNGATPPPSSPSLPSISWNDCVNINGSVILLTSPEMCVAPDGRKVSRPPGATLPPETEGPEEPEPSPATMPESGSGSISSEGAPSSTESPTFLIAWDECINTEGSVVLQTSPQICVTPDGRRAAEPTSIWESLNAFFRSVTSFLGF